MRFIGWLFAAVLLILLGWIGGPVAMATYRVAMATDPAVARSQTAEDLLDAYRRPPAEAFRLNLSIVYTPPDYRSARACGYDPDILFKDENVAFLQSADWGFEVLQRRASADQVRIIDDYRAEHFAKHHAVGTMAALSQCLNSPLAALCRGRVDRMTAAADAAGAKELAELQDVTRKQNQAILCTFLDGAAARRGIAKTAAATKPAP
ncbi:hypothetical protein [Sphingomonas sp.]|jgi:hypothetical protein|uniref:hypothetical protein n=1 Tax=Sphingomonas sp. TaxID=28214 RepID=UPI003F6F3B4E